VLPGRVEKRFDVFCELFSGVGGSVRNFLPCVELHVYNRFSHSLYPPDS
jgi:hypothetical protein